MRPLLEAGMSQELSTPVLQARVLGNPGWLAVFRGLWDQHL
jgi:hypothetical protein